MGEYVWVKMHIGGPLPQTKLDDLVEAIDSDFCETSYGDDDDLRELIETCINTKQPIAIDGNVNYADPDEVKDFCNKNGMTYWLSWEGKGGCFASGCSIAGPSLAKSAAVDEDGKVAISIGVLMNRAKAGKTLADVIAEFEPISEDKVPPLTWAEVAP